jgi:hypothetical protein
MKKRPRLAQKNKPGARGRRRNAASYRACSIKRRRSKEDVDAIRDAIKSILRDDHPQTVRQVFYQLVVRGVVEKTEAEYQQTVIRLLTEMRLAGDVSFEWIIDSSRITHETETFDNVTDALRQTARYYRRSALRECPVYVELWCEKEALAGLLWDVAAEYDVPVVVSKGMPSLTQLYGSFKNVCRAGRAGKHSFIYQFGDHDPTGCLIPGVIEERMQWFCERADCAVPHVARYAITEEQIDEYDLPTRPTKRDGNSHAQNFDGDSVELDALPSNVLRELVRNCIEQHISAEQVDILRTAEESERDVIWKLAEAAE